MIKASYITPLVTNRIRDRDDNTLELHGSLSIGRSIQNRIIPKLPSHNMAQANTPGGIENIVLIVVKKCAHALVLPIHHRITVQSN